MEDRMTLREYLDKWYELDHDYDNKLEITVWYVETAGLYTIYQNQTDKRLYNKYVRNDNLKRIVHLTEHLYKDNDKAIYVFVTDKIVDNPEIHEFEKFQNKGYIHETKEIQTLYNR